jgi:hypothetical protein
MADDDFAKTIRKLRVVLGAMPRFPAGTFRVPGWPSPHFFRHAAEILPASNT